jgi:hypothetical protein
MKKAQTGGNCCTTWIFLARRFLSSRQVFSGLAVFALPLLIRALEVFYAVFVEDPETRGYFVD